MPLSFVQEETEWNRLCRRLPAEAEAQARTTKAFQRRRGVPGVWALLRLALAYAFTEWSLRLVATWAAVQGVAQLSDVALLNRLRGAREWLGWLLAALLLDPALVATPPVPPLRLVDATSISAPGSPGTNWRVHLSLDLAAGRLDNIELTDVHGAEGLTRFPLAPGDLVVADSGYVRANDLGWVCAQQGWFLARAGWNRLRWQEAPGAPWDLIAWLRTLPPDPVAEHSLAMATSAGTYPVRLIAVRLSPAAVEQALRRLHRQASKKGYTTREETRIAAAFCLVLTNLPAERWSSAQVLAMYRVRWQVELAIKRVKSLGQLDHLRAQDPDLAQTYLLAKLIGVLLSQGLTAEVQAGCPDWFGSRERPVSLWRLQQLEWACLRQAVIGSLSWDTVRAMLIRLQRYLRDTPRQKRPQLLAWAQDWLRQGGLTAPEAGRFASPPREEAIVA